MRTGFIAALLAGIGAFICVGCDTTEDNRAALASDAAAELRASAGRGLADNDGFVQSPTTGAPGWTGGRGGRGGDVQSNMNNVSDFTGFPTTGAPGAIVMSPPASLSEQNPGQVVQLSVDSGTTEPTTARIIVYSGSIHLVVVNVSSTLESIRKSAESMGGYLQDMDSHSITVRVPALQFEKAVEAVGRFGEVADKQIKAEDITEQMRDLNIRLDNAETTRQRLLKLLDKSTNVEETVKIEDELEKVTEQVELLKGKIRFLQLDVSYSVLHVDLNSPLPQAHLVAAIPFPWVRELGKGAVGGATPEMARQSGIFSGGVGFDLPSGYICFYKQDDLTEAMNADGVMIRVERHDNYKGGDLKFWSTLAHRALIENNSIAITRESDPADRTHLIEGTKDVPGNMQGYMLMVTVDGGHVYTYEAWGNKPLVDRDSAILEKSATSVDR
jgi:hypothetical protein